MSHFLPCDSLLCGRPGHTTARGPHPAFYSSPSCPRDASQQHSQSHNLLSFSTFGLKFENLLLFFNVCGDLCTIISHSIIQILLEPAAPAI